MDNNAIARFFKPLKDYWVNLEKNKKIRLIILTALALVLIIVSVILLNRTEYSVLYSNLESGEAGEILDTLTEMGVGAKAQGTGTILVPKKQEDKLRMELSAKGYPKSGLNYDLFKNSSGFGTTDYEKQKYMQFQLQDRLQNSIKSLDVVDDAIVTLYIPESSSFVLKADKESASASVILRLKNGTKLTEDQVSGIEGLVAKSVAGLKEDQVFIIDNMGNTVNSPTDSKDSSFAKNQLDLEEKVSGKYKEQIDKMLEPVFGTGKVVTGVRVALDFDKKSTETTSYSPVGDSSGGIPVSESETKETAANSQGSGVIGQDANGGSAPQYPQTTSGGGEYQKTDKTVNYEINQIKEMLQKAEGNVKDISVSVILDSNNLQDGAADKVKQIVAGATGISSDKVVVQTMSFDSKTGIDNIFNSVNESQQLLKKQQYIRNATIYGALGVILLLTIFGILFFKRKKETEYDFDKTVEFGMLEGSDDSKDIDFSLKKSDKRELIEKNVDSNPEFIAQLLRNWLEEDGG